MLNQPRKIRVSIVDDEPFARERVRRLLGAESDIEIVGEAGDGLQAVEMIRATRPDLLFLDIQMPGRDGFAVLENLSPEEMPVVVFLTAFDRYAVRAFETAALDYILKPFDEERFTKALARARTVLSQISALGGNQIDAPIDLGEVETEASSALSAGQKYLERIIIRSGGRVFFRRAEEIDWIEAEGNYVRLHADTKTYQMRETIGSLEAQLDPEKFARIHRSAIVQIGKIREAQPTLSGSYKLILENGEQIVMSRRFRRRLPKSLVS